MIIQGASGLYQADVDRDKNLRIVQRPPGFGALGAYSKGMRTGAIVATGSANAVLWLMRWTDATRFAMIERIKVAANVASAITNAVPYALELYAARTFSVNPTTNIGSGGAGGTYSFSGNVGKRRTSMGTSIMAGGGGMWALGTAAAGMTGQTLGNDADPIATIVGGTGTAIGTSFFGAGFASLFDVEACSHPLILAAGEGLAIQAPLAGPATGTFIVSITVDWQEISEY